MCRATSVARLPARPRRVKRRQSKTGGPCSLRRNRRPYHVLFDPPRPKSHGSRPNPAPGPDPLTALPDSPANCRRASILLTRRHLPPAWSRPPELRFLRMSRLRRLITISLRWLTNLKQPCGALRHRKPARRSLTLWLLRSRALTLPRARRSAKCARALSRNSNRSLNQNSISNPRLAPSRRPRLARICTRISKRRWPVCWAVLQENRDRRFRPPCPSGDGGGRSSRDPHRADGNRVRAGHQRQLWTR